MPAARAPRVYAAEIDGVHEWIVAAANQREALDALGVNQDLFAQGLARPERDPVKVEAARDQPGVPLRRAKGSKAAFEAAGDGGSAWAAALEATPKGKKAAKPAAKAPTGAPKRPPPEKSKGPTAADRKALREAEGALRAFDRTAAKALGALDAEIDAVERRRARLRREQDQRRGRLQRAVDKARSAVETPR